MSRPRSSRPRFSLVRYALGSLLLLAAAALLTTTPAAAQDTPGVSTGTTPKISGQISGRATVGVPRGGLRNNISGVGGGLHLYIGGWTGSESPLMVGLDVGFLRYGNATEEVPFSSTVGPRVPIEVETSNNVLETHLSLRLQRRRGRFRPYVEGLAGFKYLFTRTSLAEADFDDDANVGDEIAGSTNYDDFALSGGAGAGIDVRLYQPDDPTKSVRAVSLHLGVQYLLGQEAEYLAEGNLNDDNENGQLDESEMDVRRSRTTFLQPQFGVTLRLADTD